MRTDPQRRALSGRSDAAVRGLTVRDGACRTSAGQLVYHGVLDAPFFSARLHRLRALVVCTGLTVLAMACGGATEPARRSTAPAAAEPTQAPSVTAEPPASSAHAKGDWPAARRLLERRCVVCHGCYDAPCQLALSTFDGIERGASKTQVYDGARLLAIAPTRLFVDAQDVTTWREKGFHPVLPEGVQRDPSASVLLRMLELKQKVPLPVSDRLPDDVQIGLDREQVCPRGDELDEFEREHPSWGMPYGLPGLSADEHALLSDWVRAGTPHEPEPLPAPALREVIERWERFLNGRDDKSRLMARYLYEHLFLASLYFEELDRTRFFRLVRARNATGEPVVEVATRRPFEDPGPEPFYYRIVPRPGVVLEKTHMPYPLYEKRLARWRALFLEPSYEVGGLPPWDLRTAANPFAAFAAIPVASRYRFMLDEARFTIGGFIKGPVCRGQVALDVIEDRFWITFVDPDSPVIQSEAELLRKAQVDLGLPAEQGSNGLLVTWNRYARRQKAFLRQKSAYLARLAKTTPADLRQIWNGDGHNDNAGLTVFRNFDSASVNKGLLGGPPKTSWVIGYALLERIHYLLVAGFDVFGNVGHQLHTRMYMDFLRMEAEQNYLLLLPEARRRPLVEAWYRDTSSSVKDQVYGDGGPLRFESAIRYETAQPERELPSLLERHLAKVLQTKHTLGEERDRALRTSLSALAAVEGNAASLLPETSFLEVSDGAHAPRYFTILRESAHTNVAHLFREESRRRPAEDRLTVLRGLVGAYPNVLFRVERTQLDAFVATVAALDGDAAYASLRVRFSIRRTNPGFWAHSDRLQEAQHELEPLEGGLFDYNRLDDR